ncbi:hypothetical protein AJ79_08909 [Helicocarpus griseus UAMH5409]|uniref:Putative gamma-glutamylcyclotransferase n=1 Tax=Helicocarpus griseus UAMH5409 TaxID=1447875 RepID=A0A2B7WNZ6_9EURO|nr:hypothetical protein AJ79_08909 [Helicocarpus griseus UAMH5409]
MQHKFFAAAEAITNGSFQTKPPWKPKYMFFYGTLMDPEVLQAVLHLDETPFLQDASIRNSKIKLWTGIYPALFPCEGNSISGKAFFVECFDDYLALARWQSRYKKYVICK